MVPCAEITENSSLNGRSYSSSAGDDVKLKVELSKT